MKPHCLVTTVFVVIVGSTVLGQDSGEIDRFVKQLGSAKFKEREAASKELETIGERALEALRRAAAEDADLEVRSRARGIIQSIQRRLDHTDVAGVPPPRDAIVLLGRKGLDGWIHR